MFDFALFENVTTGINHQKDLHIIAKLLKDSGFNVCILGYCKEQNITNDIPFISVSNPYHIPEMEFGYRWTFFFRLIKWYINKNHYIRYFINQAQGVACNYYCGSFLKETDIRFLKQHGEANYFFWGLRSHLFKMRVKDWLHPITAFRKWSKIKLVKKSQNIKFFISNELIRQEFIDCGISSNRLVLRPERFIDSDKVNNPVIDTPFTFLSIGTIRKEKRIPMLISAFKGIHNNDCHYDIAGRCGDVILNDIIKTLIQGEARILRDERRLSEEVYNSYLEKCHFLLLCDVQQQSTVTNGTMMEALLMGKPIIAPNYNPYKYYVEKYHIGLLFNGTSEESLRNTMNEAITIGAEFFQPALKNFGQLFLYGNIQKQFLKELQNIGITTTQINHEIPPRPSI